MSSDSSFVSSPLSRRSVLKAGVAAGVPLFLPSHLFGADSPSNRLNVAFVGTGNQGMGLLKKFLGADLANVVAVCDVNRGSYGYREPSHFYGREPARKLVNDHEAKKRNSASFKGCAAEKDFRRILERDDVDAVLLVVPDHWHAEMTVLAAEAGKDIYCEKPLSLTVRSGQEMVQAVRKNNRVLQTGSQERSNPVSRFVCEKVKSGELGKVKRVITKVGYNNKVGPGPGWKAMPVPEGFDYDMWLGPAPKVPYHADRCLYRFRFNYDYSGGQITNFGAHSNDLAHWGMGVDTSGPVEIECLDAKFLPEGSLFNTATETRFRCLYENGVELICESGPEKVQARFECEDGWIETGYAGTHASDPEMLKGLPEKNEGGLPHTQHMANFIDCVKTRKDPTAPVEVGHASANLCHLANIVIRRFPQTGSGEVLKWDAKAERFTNSDEANQMLERPIRAAYDFS
ncbi:Gfo/Idh/MocA family protein [Calycomorphotria hydatis]|uniref:Glucose--fructose oxidoreductase n=1 Tax=Calycomorphotria hydatis TaxID=2528027 RepID=A0A517T627_9PLAN|nr:Gfo/Idh/MocA family oxidoreductase [Calycomorphotria hydatis]QDT63836.1 Glucose--fructose oxidoreductase precursor [Calycomorphotria hydatis]